MLIRLIGSAFAGFIERGSLWGAALGGVIGAAAGFLIAYLLRANDLLDRYWIGAAIAMALVLGFACAAAGSRLLPHDLAGRGEDVILTNFNRALVAPAFLVGITALAVLAVRGEQRQQGHINWLHPLVLVPGGLILILLLVSVRSTLAVRVGKQIVFYRVWRTRRFSREQVRDWGFEFARGKYTHAPPDRRTPFQIECTGHPTFETVVSATTARRLVDVLGGIGPART